MEENEILEDQIEANDNEEQLEAEQHTDEVEASEADEQEQLDPLEKAEKELAELKDQYLRKVAEFENYRKRTLKEKTELILNGAEKTVDAMLPVVDDMERAIDNASKSDDVKAIREGLDLIFKLFYFSILSLNDMVEFIEPFI